MVINRFVVTGHSAVGMQVMMSPLFQTEAEAVQYVKSSFINSVADWAASNNKPLFTELKAMTFEESWEKLCELTYVLESSTSYMLRVFDNGIALWDELSIREQQITLSDNERWETHKEFVIAWMRMQIEAELRVRGRLSTRSVSYSDKPDGVDTEALAEDAFARYCHDEGTETECYMNALEAWLEADSYTKPHNDFER